MRIFAVIILGFLLSACSVKTQIRPLIGGGYEIVSQSDALVIIRPDGGAVVDNRGRVSAAEMLFSSLFTDAKKIIEIDVDEFQEEGE
ncbi:hypothetical protein KAR91_42045 [Candidatus Pacearchaeota archaeon]|nr:hypothetical protein [Candidatus Pacearchaeota archaeon]